MLSIAQIYIWSKVNFFSNVMPLIWKIPILLTACLCGCCSHLLTCGAKITITLSDHIMEAQNKGSIV